MFGVKCIARLPRGQAQEIAVDVLFSSGLSGMEMEQHAVDSGLLYPGGSRGFKPCGISPAVLPSIRANNWDHLSKFHLTDLFILASCASSASRAS
jgi:hypothetical protein